jgi:hypothetical protein
MGLCSGAKPVGPAIRRRDPTPAVDSGAPSSVATPASPRAPDVA